MNKSKYEPADYFGFYQAALATYANTVLGANALMLGYTIAATRTVLRATALAAAQEALPVAFDPPAELAQIEEALYADDARPDSTGPAVIETAAVAPSIEPARDSLETIVTPRSNGSKKAGARRRRGNK